MLRNQALVVGLRFNCQKKPFVKKQFIVLFFFLRNTLDFYQVETFMAGITDPRNKNTSPPQKKKQNKLPSFISTPSQSWNLRPLSPGPKNFLTPFN